MLEQRRLSNVKLIEGIGLVALCAIAVAGCLIAAESSVPELVPV